MADEKLELTDQQLDEACGGKEFVLPTEIFNSKHQKVGFWPGNGKPIRYVPCDKCGKPMHTGTFGWYCDPCNRRLWSINYYIWKGTEDELKAASV